jgi:hypothetical protein
VTIFISQHVSAYLAYIRRIKVVGEFIAILYTVVNLTKCCAINMLNKYVQLEIIKSVSIFKILNFKNFSVSCS